VNSQTRRWLQRVLLAIGTVFVLFLGWGVAERVRGPSMESLPASLPHIVRNPTPGPVPDWRSSSPPKLDPVVDNLHRRGIRGRGAGIAVIDSFLFADHREFRGHLCWYDEIDATSNDPAGWHGTATASIAAGSTVGVAPEADLYFVGLGLLWAGPQMSWGNWFVAARRAAHIGQPLPIAIHRILELNRRLAADRRIRAISIAIGLTRWNEAGAIAAFEEARRAGVFVSAVDLRLEPYGPVTVASPTAPDAYVTYPAAGSWSIAYWAGRYIVASQDDPNMTPSAFLDQIRHETTPRKTHPTVAR
jgi:hypothetical protein